MAQIEIRKIEELNYEVCSYILRNRLYNAIIHCGSAEIMESLTIYMTVVGIPWTSDHGLRCVAVVSSSDDAPQHVYISTDKNSKLASMMKDAAAAFLLRDIPREEIESLVADPETFDLDSVPMHLKNEEIRKMFLKSFLIAESEIDIISPWMNFSVVNDALINLMRQALERGVSIRIIYGLQSSSDEYNQIRSDRSDQVAERLRTSFAEFGDLFHVSRDNIHYKLVLCDEKFKLEGGYNYLSFAGDYSDPNTRREGSPFGRDANEIRYLRKEYFRDDQMER